MQPTTIPDLALLPTIFQADPDIEAVYLFGSYAAGHPRPGSDLDLAIVPRHPRIRQQRLAILTDLAFHGFCNVDLVFLDTDDIVLKYEAVRLNQLVYQTADFDRGSLYSLVVRQYFDFLPYLDVQRAAYKQRFYMNNSHALIDAWRNCPLTDAPYILPGDDKLPQNKIFTSLDEYIQDQETFGMKDTNLHLGLIPIPYIGYLEKATVFILMLNPGLSPVDYFAEYEFAGFRDTQVKNLRQENAADEFPFFPLNPQLCWHSGYQYWEGKFRSIAQELVKEQQIPYWQILKILSRRIACLELLPYHSKSFDKNSLLEELRSCKLMLDYAHEILVPRAKNDEIVIIVTRSVEKWKLPQHKNIIQYDRFQARSASLTTQGVRAAIKEKLESDLVAHRLKGSDYDPNLSH